MNLLALDLATLTGWAWGPCGPSLPLIGHVRMPSTGEDVGRFLCAWERELTDLLDVSRPEVVCFEAPILPRQGAQLSTTRKLQGLAGVTEMLCHKRSLDCREVQPATVKKNLTGRGNAEKHEMEAAARRYGLSPVCPDEADAFGVFLTAMRALAPAQASEFDRAFAPVLTGGR